MLLSFSSLVSKFPSEFPEEVFDASNIAKLVLGAREKVDEGKETWKKKPANTKRFPAKPDDYDELIQKISR